MGSVLQAIDGSVVQIDQRILEQMRSNEDSEVLVAKSEESVRNVMSELGNRALGLAIVIELIKIKDLID